MNTAETLRKAQDALRAHGWTKGNFVDADLRVCGIGAVMCAVEPNFVERFHSGFGAYPDTLDAENLLSDVAAEQFPERHDRVHGFATFNDHPDTTLDDVMLVFEKAVVRAEEEVR